MTKKRRQTLSIRASPDGSNKNVESDEMNEDESLIDVREVDTFSEGSEFGTSMSRHSESLEQEEFGPEAQYFENDENQPNAPNLGQIVNELDYLHEVTEYLIHRSRTGTGIGQARWYYHAMKIILSAVITQDNWKIAFVSSSSSAFKLAQKSGGAIVIPKKTIDTIIEMLLITSDVSKKTEDQRSYFCKNLYECMKEVLANFRRGRIANLVTTVEEELLAPIEGH
ncbi:unnamed protein product [Caenorhabditis auriculariae]|uniref:Uncharacterized protein n=1 Tax=Caenorhabditis auriculariae TaxID=2777116 RepID=A0A8S1H7D5_9PELO|nr:unnamed protein product [Caenorhabditis auriculariae]